MYFQFRWPPSNWGVERKVFKPQGLTEGKVPGHKEIGPPSEWREGIVGGGATNVRKKRKKKTIRGNSSSGKAEIEKNVLRLGFRLGSKKKSFGKITRRGELCGRGGSVGTNSTPPGKSTGQRTIAKGSPNISFHTRKYNKKRGRFTYTERGNGGKKRNESREKGHHEQPFLYRHQEKHKSEKRAQKQ